jgi:hypothetical protein
MNGIYDLLNAYTQKNDPRFTYDGLYEEPAYTGPNLDPMYNIGQRQFGNIRAGNINVNQTEGIMQQAPGFPLYDDMNSIIDTSYNVANEPDEEEAEQYEVDQFGYRKKPSGIAKLFEFLGKLPTPFSLARRGLESLRGLNDRIQSTDFAQSKNLADYFDARSYGGLQARDDTAARTMAQARGIQKKIDTGEYRRTAADNVIDRGRGENNIASRAPKGPTGARRGIDAKNKSSIDPAVGRRG